MSRPKTSVNRLDNLRNAFTSNKGKVFTCKQVEETVGASYWRACVKDLKDEGLNITAVRDGRTVVGYKLMDGTATTVVTGVKKAASKPKAGVKAKAKKVTVKAAPKAKKVKEEKKAVTVKAKKVSVKAASKPKGKDVADVIAEMDPIATGDDDAEIAAILKAAGLGDN